MTVYTLATWRVRPGHEDRFVAEWRALAERTKADFAEATARLLRDREDPTLFVSSGPWPSLDRVAEWRASPAFTESLARIREHLAEFEPHTMDLVVEIEP